MRVTFATEPTPGRVNEDVVLATPDVAVVLDGAGLPDGSDTGCRHGVPWYVRTLGTRLAGLLTTQPDTSMVDALARAIADTTAAHGDTCEPTHPNSPSSTVAAVRVVDDRLEWLVLADSTVVLDTTHGIEAVTDPRVAQAVAARRAAMEREAVGTVEHDRARRRLLTAQRRIRNVPDGYWVAADDPAAAGQSLTGARSLGEVRRVALLTDGASRPVDLFGQVTWEAHLARLATGGPQALLDDVRAWERSDADGARWPRSKRHDDATALLATP